MQSSPLKPQRMQQKKQAVDLWYLRALATSIYYGIGWQLGWFFLRD